LLLIATTSPALADSPPNPIDPSVPPPQATANVVPAAQIDAAIARLNDLAAEMLNKTHIPGLAISVARDGKTAYAAGFGVRRAGTTDAVDADTVFQLASLSKSVGANRGGPSGGGGRSPVGYADRAVSPLVCPRR
jgi:CubicO group peptidase (beta-lactamase class C family)